MTKVTIDKAPRATREKETRRRPWTPPSRLDAPPAPEGFKHRWIRAEVNGFQDKQNVYGRLREGYELVRAEEYPDWDLPTINDGKHAGVIAVGGLVLARIPNELVRQRTDYYRKQTQQQLQAVDNDLMREQHPSMPVLRPERQSRVTFGGNRSSE